MFSILIAAYLPRALVLTNVVAESIVKGLKECGKYLVYDKEKYIIDQSFENETMPDIIQETMPDTIPIPETVPMPILETIKELLSEI